MAVTTFLADTSVWARVGQSAVYTAFAPLLKRGLIGTCGVVDLEVLFSARNGDEHAELRADRDALTWLPSPDEVWDRAKDVQAVLANKGVHRAVSLSDLIIAATAERNRVAVLHYDADFELIADVTGQPVKWVVPRGTADPS